MTLFDPRRYGTGDATDRFLALAHEGKDRELIRALRELAAERADTEIRALLAAAPSAACYARLWRALCVAVEKPRAEDALTARAFAIPWVIVCAANGARTIPCVLPDVSELARVLNENGVFGPTRNVGLASALSSIEAIEEIAPGDVLEWAQNRTVREIPPAPIVLAARGEEVHVRLLPGAAIVAAAAPDIVATGSNIGVWGAPALRAMRAQLETPDVQILPMPRPPAGLYSAAYAGRRAGIEAAFNLFVSNAVRQFRRRVGDPRVNLSAHAGPELRVTLWSPFEGEVEGFRWPLHPADDLAEIERTLKVMIAECRLEEPHISPGVLADRSTTGALLFPTA
jgi:hypothetical protein